MSFLLINVPNFLLPITNQTDLFRVAQSAQSQNEQQQMKRPERKETIMIVGRFLFVHLLLLVSSS
jgi:hypothetical protein